MHARLCALCTELSPTLYNSMDYSLPGSSVHGIFQARIQNTRVGCHFLLQGNLPYPGIEHKSLELAGRFFTTAQPRKPIMGGSVVKTVEYKVELKILISQIAN